MFIQTEETPNPNSLKFIPGVEVSPEGPVAYNSKDQCDDSPLAKRLFDLEYITGIFLGSDFVTVTKNPDIAWEIIKPELLINIMEHFISGKPAVFSENYVAPKIYDENDDEITKQIKEILHERVRPAVAQDGGDIIFSRFENGVVYLELRGSCSGCPSSQVTLKEGVENMLKHYIPEIISVESV
jgi:Fe-S cluster biogenesis protein NfuA